MFNRRLIVLFIGFALGFLLFAIRLANLQLANASYWRNQVQEFVHRTYGLETYRGPIVDRNGILLAQDVPSDDLAIDYRAMNLDDRWLTVTAVDRLKTSGEWAALPDRASRRRRLEQMKDQLAEQIDGIPAAIAKVCGVPKEEILERFNEIRARIHALRQDQWARKFDRDAAKAKDGSAASSNGASEVDDLVLDQTFRETQLREELTAHTIRGGISPAIANYFRQHAAEFPGLIVRDKVNRRDYPLGDAMAHIIGTMRGVDNETLDASRFKFPDLLAADDTAGGNLKGYLPGDRMGESGVERLMEDTLRGTRGCRLVDITDDGEESDDKKDVKGVAAEPGGTVRLTIDAALQADLYHALLDPGRRLLIGQDGKPHFAAIVVLSVEDGQVLAMVSVPSYDPNQIEDFRVALQQDWRRPLLSKAFREIYHPGSTIKPLLAAGALTEGLITRDETINCVGHYYPSRADILRCDDRDGHGPIALVQALAQSCNVYFYTVGARMGMDRLVNWYGRYGFGQQTGLELGDARGNLPQSDYSDPESAKRDSIYLGIGQGPIDVTPLQMANAYATLLRGGIAVKPRLLADSPVQASKAFDIGPATLATVREGMEQCTMGSHGTARTIFRNFPLAVAGKTGTAEKERLVFDDNGNPVDNPQKPRKNPDDTPKLKPDGTPMYYQLVERHDDAWFVGYAPARQPKFVVAAIMEWGGHGGTSAAPMVREAFTLLQKYNYLPRGDAGTGGGAQ